MAARVDEFDLDLAVECANAYSKVSGLGCTIYDFGGEVLFEVGPGCASCKVCAAAGMNRDNCRKSHEKGINEAERFGGIYIYFCSMGLTFFVSPIIGKEGSTAKVTVGPFFMVEREDYVAYDLQKRLLFGDDEVRKILDASGSIPYVPTEKVNPLSILLFMSVSFMNNVSDSKRMLEMQKSGELQGRINGHIMELKTGEASWEYPYKTEKELTSSIAESDRPRAQMLLNEILGHILFSSGGDFARIKTRMCELLVVMSRAAVDAGASAEHAFSINHEFFVKAAATADIDGLCFLLADVMNRYIDSIFEFSEVQNAYVIKKAVRYMRSYFSKKITLEDVAAEVYLSPTYFSKVFKKEMGCSLSAYLNKLRIDKAKQFLLQSELQLVEIAYLLGFEDQSYFTKVFKRLIGVSPNQFRKSGGKLQKHT